MRSPSQLILFIGWRVDCGSSPLRQERLLTCLALGSTYGAKWAGADRPLFAPGADRRHLDRLARSADRNNDGAASTVFDKFNAASEAQLAFCDFCSEQTSRPDLRSFNSIIYTEGLATLDIFNERVAVMQMKSRAPLVRS